MGNGFNPIRLCGSPLGNATGYSEPNFGGTPDGCRLLAVDLAVPNDVLPAPGTHIGFNDRDTINVTEDGTLTWRHYDYMGGQTTSAFDFAGTLVRTNELGLTGAAIYELQYDDSACGPKADTSKPLFFIYNPNNGFFGLIVLGDSGNISGIDQLHATS